MWNDLLEELSRQLACIALKTISSFSLFFLIFIAVCKFFYSETSVLSLLR